jgi:hypothetical protein
MSTTTAVVIAVALGITVFASGYGYFPAVRLCRELKAFGLFLVAAFGGLVGYVPRPVLVRLDNRTRRSGRR